MEENEIENSGLMIDIETKIPYEIGRKRKQNRKEKADT